MRLTNYLVLLNTYGIIIISQTTTITKLFLKQIKALIRAVRKNMKTLISPPIGPCSEI
jgi:hypothetical protein